MGEGVDDRQEPARKAFRRALADHLEGSHPNWYLDGTESLDDLVAWHGDEHQSGESHNTSRLEVVIL